MQVHAGQAATSGALGFPSLATTSATGGNLVAGSPAPSSVKSKFPELLDGLVEAADTTNAQPIPNEKMQWGAFWLSRNPASTTALGQPAEPAKATLLTSSGTDPNSPTASLPTASVAPDPPPATPVVPLLGNFAALSVVPVPQANIVTPADPNEDIADVVAQGAFTRNTPREDTRAPASIPEFRTLQTLATPGVTYRSSPVGGQTSSPAPSTTQTSALVAIPALQPATAPATPQTSVGKPMTTPLPANLARPAALASVLPVLPRQPSLSPSSTTATASAATQKPVEGRMAAAFRTTRAFPSAATPAVSPALAQASPQIATPVASLPVVPTAQPVVPAAQPDVQSVVEQPASATSDSAKATPFAASPIPTFRTAAALSAVVSQPSSQTARAVNPRPSNGTAQSSDSNPVENLAPAIDMPHGTRPGPVEYMPAANSAPDARNNSVAATLAVPSHETSPSVPLPSVPAATTPPTSSIANQPIPPETSSPKVTLRSRNESTASSQSPNQSPVPAPDAMIAPVIVADVPAPTHATESPEEERESVRSTPPAPEPARESANAPAPSHGSAVSGPQAPMKVAFTAKLQPLDVEPANSPEALAQAEPPAPSRGTLTNPAHPPAANRIASAPVPDAAPDPEDSTSRPIPDSREKSPGDQTDRWRKPQDDPARGPVTTSVSQPIVPPINVDNRASGATSHPAATPEAPEQTARPSDPPAEPAPAAPARDIKLQVGEEGGPHVEVRLTERGGDVMVSVRTPDSHLAGELRADLPALSSRLEQSGYRTETWQPVATGERQHLADPMAGAAAQDAQNQQRQNGGGQQPGQQEQEQKDPKNIGNPSQSKEPGKDFEWLLSSLR